jgi:hypothetical protein
MVFVGTRFSIGLQIQPGFGTEKQLGYRKNSDSKTGYRKDSDAKTGVQKR